MSYDAYRKIMFCLDRIEDELNNVADIVGAPSFAEWQAEQQQ